MIGSLATVGAEVSRQLPAPLLAGLEPFRLRATLGPVAGLPTVLEMGVEDFQLEGLPRAAEGEGHAFAAREWIDGWRLTDARTSLPPDAKRAVVQAIARVLQHLHDRQLGFDALAPDVIVLGGPRR